MSHPRNPSLDVLRCAAILLVLGSHFEYYRFWNRIGWIGVDLFFVLSGFLISGLLFEDYKELGRIRIGRFLLRRGFKIYPSYYLFVSVLVLLTFVSRSNRSFADFWTLRKPLLATLTFTQNYLGWTGRVAGHTWTLAVEEHFYLALPLLLWVLLWLRRGSRDPFKPILGVFVFLAVACLILRTSTPHVLHEHFVTQTHLRIDSLFAGVTLGYLYHFRAGWFARLKGPWALVLAILFCLPAAFFENESRFMQTVGLTSMFVGFSFLLGWAVDRRAKSRWGKGAVRVFALVGFYSYSIYLWHRPIAMILESTHSALGYWCYVAIAIAFGFAMAVIVEIPGLAMRDRLFAPETSPVSTTKSQPVRVP
jgi:peptidoglycan/LPS O-acetylase OafA/YrhL